MSRATFFRGVLPVLCKNSTDLELWTSVPVDDQFSSPKQCRWSTVLGKLLVADGSNFRAAIRNADLTYYSKRGRTDAISSIDADDMNIYAGFNGYVNKVSLSVSGYFTNIDRATVAGVRMIDASGDPSYIYVTSNNGTDHHGFRQVKKSTMTVTASALADGAGDGQFDDPLGIFYYSGEVFIADYDNSRISVWTVSGETLTYARKYDLGFKPMDLCFDGTNWYIQSATNTYKYDNAFTDATKTSIACVGYSITLIPDQGDGYGATLCIVNNSGSCLYRRKCSDLSLITTVGSAGNGSSSKFDPTFTTSQNTRITYQMDDGWQYTTPLGTSHAISWNGFDGYSFRNAGPHRCVVRVEGGLGSVTGIDCNTDALTFIKNLIKCNNLDTVDLYVNSTLALDLSQINHNANRIYCTGNWSMYGSIAGFYRATYFKVTECPARGALSDLAVTLQTGFFYACISITAASISHLIAIRDLRIYSMDWSQANVDLVIDSMWQARASYTYAAGPSLQIGGTNAAPTGNLIAPVEGSDWHNDGLKWIPLTGKAKVWDMLNDVNSEGFHKWFSIATS